jgi:3D (Asp-Asp-Asp) domain-containing protein
MVWTMLVTAYVRTCDGCTGIVASGRERDPSAMVVAASKAWQRLVVEDRGRAIDRKNELDLLVATEAKAVAWGHQEIPVRYCNDYERGPR